MMVHWPSYLYIYPSWTDILAYYTDRITDVTVRGYTSCWDSTIHHGHQLCPKGNGSLAHLPYSVPQGTFLKQKAHFATSSPNLEHFATSCFDRLDSATTPQALVFSLSDSLRQAPGPAAPVVQNAFMLLAAAGQAAYCRKKTVPLHEVQCWFQSPTDKGQLAAALQTRLEQVGVSFLSSDKDTLRRLVVTKGMQQCKAPSDFLSRHVRSGLYVWQYCKHPPTAKTPASKTVEQAHAAAPSHPAATVAASDDAAAPGAPSLPESLHSLPGPVPCTCDGASAALLNEWPGDAEHKTHALYGVLQGL
jgi:hypothetical protein